MALTPVPTIDPALPVPPNPADEEAVFDAKAYAWSNALPGFGGDVKAIGDATYTNAQWAQAKASEATTQAGLATTNGAAQVSLAAQQVALATAQAELATTNGAAQVALAATQAENAASSAAAAADSAEESAESAAEAAALTEKYQGALAADPALDKTGGPLTDGDWYVSAVTGLIRAYTVAGGWVNGLSAVAGVTSVNGNSGAITGVVTETGAQSLTEKTLVNPLLFLGGSNGTAGQVPISQGAGLPVIWGAGSELIRVARTSNTAISSTNKGNLIDITSGTFTQTFNSAASLSNGWFCYVRNSGTGDITLDPNSSELIDGLTSYVMYPCEMRLVQCDGAAFRTVVLNSFYKVFTASGNFIKPPGYSLFDGLLWSAGGSGRVGAASTLRIGGGGGACCSFSLRYSDIGTTQVVTIGSGGLAVSAASTNGNAGGNSEFSGIAAFGGKGGSDSDIGNGGNAFYGSLTGSANQSTASASPFTSSIYGGGNGGAKYADAGVGQTVYGGGGGRQITTSNTISDPGSTVFGGAGGTTNNAGTAATAGSAPGGGGGAATNGSSSGSGARGELRICGVI